MMRVSRFIGRAIRRPRKIATDNASKMPAARNISTILTSCWLAAVTSSMYATPTSRQRVLSTVCTTIKRSRSSCVSKKSPMTFLRIRSVFRDEAQSGSATAGCGRSTSYSGPKQVYVTAVAQPNPAQQILDRVEMKVHRQYAHVAWPMTPVFHLRGQRDHPGVLAAERVLQVGLGDRHGIRLRALARLNQSAARIA